MNLPVQLRNLVFLAADLFLYNDCHIAVLPLLSTDITKVHSSLALTAALAMHLTSLLILQVLLLLSFRNCSTHTLLVVHQWVHCRLTNTSHLMAT